MTAVGTGGRARFLCVLFSMTTLGCSADAPIASGPFKCPSAAPGAVSYGCVLVTGAVVGPAGEVLDGISGAVRATEQCGCRNVAIPVDTIGRFSITLERTLKPASAAPDTATIVVYAGATAGKYPRSVTGDPFFDTTSVKLTFSAVGATAAQFNVLLRIPLPPP